MKGTRLIKESYKPVCGRTGKGGRTLVLAGTFLLIAAIASGQSLEGTLQQKDLAFSQVATGPTIETVICVTNRGESAYRGNINFWRGSNEDWNPVVNGNKVSGSALEITVDPGETRVFRIGGNASLEVGAASISAANLSQDNFVEGNLTYSIEDQDYDSVGIAPSIGLYRSVIPFEDFASVGLALANSNRGSSANVTLRLMDELGDLQESVLRTLTRRSHEARFLSEIFTAEVGTGKVEIESNLPILGTAVTLTRGEISALPILPSPVAYTVHFRSQGRTDTAEVGLWAEGPFVKGYMRFLLLDGEINEDPATYLVTGTLLDGVLRITQFGAGPQIGMQETINSVKVPGFSFEGHSYTGGYTRIFPWLSFPLNQILGTYELIRRD